MHEMDRFNEAIRNNPEILKELKAVGADIEKIVQFANDKGFNFTVEDLKKHQPENGELSDTDLDNVAGGEIGVVLGQTVTVAGVVAVFA